MWHVNRTLQNQVDDARGLPKKKDFESSTPYFIFGRFVFSNVKSWEPAWRKSILFYEWRKYPSGLPTWMTKIPNDVLIPSFRRTSENDRGRSVLLDCTNGHLTGAFPSSLVVFPFRVAYRLFRRNDGNFRIPSMQCHTLIVMRRVKLVNDMRQHNKVSSGTFHHKQMVTKHLIRTFPWPFDTSCLASESFCIWKVGIARYKGGSWRGLPDSTLSCNYFRQIINSILDSMECRHIYMQLDTMSIPFIVGGFGFIKYS